MSVDSVFPWSELCNKNPNKVIDTFNAKAFTRQIILVERKNEFKQFQVKSVMYACTKLILRVIVKTYLQIISKHVIKSISWKAVSCWTFKSSVLVPNQFVCVWWIAVGACGERSGRTVGCYPDLNISSCGHDGSSSTSHQKMSSYDQKKGRNKTDCYVSCIALFSC